VADDPITASAIRRYEERLAKDPTSLAFAPLADAYRKAGRIKEAIDLCQEGLSRHPDFPAARMILARAYMADGNQEEALRELNRVAAITPDDVQCHRLLADLYRKAGELDRAVIHLERVISLDPGDKEAKAARDLLKGQTPQGEAQGVRRLLLDDDTFATVTFGSLCFQQGLLDEAAAIFVRVLRREPGNRAVRERLEEVLKAKTQRKRGSS
jgi:tetratricopeptide (TPR) repeat protein